MMMTLQHSGIHPCKGSVHKCSMDKRKIKDLLQDKTDHKAINFINVKVTYTGKKMLQKCKSRTEINTGYLLGYTCIRISVVLVT